MRRSVALAAILMTTLFAGCHVPEDDGDERLGSSELFETARMPAGNPRPQTIGDCSTLLDVLNARALAEAEVAIQGALNGSGHAWFGGGLLQRGRGFMMADAMVAAGAPAPSAAGADVTGTNNQEAGVDEADFIKTDGEWTYVVRGATLYILRSVNVGDVREHARVALDNQSYGGELLLEPRDPDDPSDDRLVLIRQGWDAAETGIAADSMVRGYYGRQMTHIQVLSLADRSAPAVLDEFWVQGYLMGARLINGYAYFVIHDHQHDLPLRRGVHPTEDELAARNLTWQSYWNLPEAGRRALWNATADAARAENAALVANATLMDHLPAIYRSAGAGTRSETTLDESGCRRFLATENATGRSVSTIMALAVRAERPQPSFTQIVGGTPIVYGAENALVLAAPTRDFWWFWGNADVDEATDLQWFDLNGLNVTLRASGRVPGIVQDSFGLDVHDDQLRVATTTGTWGRWWIADEEREPMLNHVAVFSSIAGQLLPMGAVGGIAPGERLWSARFTDDRAYLVTFEQVDPLWIIDLTDPLRPLILGELEIPGVSTYIHPLSDDLLLTIGYGPGPNDEGLDWGRIQVSLFDISDPQRPSRAALLDVSPTQGWAFSGATHEHKAFTYWDRLGVLAIPLSWSRHDVGPSQHHIGLRLIDVDVGNESLSIRGDVDQNMLTNPSPYYWGGEVERSYFLGYPETGEVSVYSVSGRGVTAHDLESLTLQGNVTFPYGQYGWY